MGSISIFWGGYTFTELAVAGTEVAEGIETEGVEELALELAYKLVFSPSVLVDVDSTDSEVGACWGLGSAWIVYYFYSRETEDYG